MNELISYLKQHFDFEVVKKEKNVITVRWERENAYKFKSITEKVLSDSTTTPIIKFYKLGLEKQYYVYKIYFIFNTEFDSEKVLELYKSIIENVETK